MHYHRHEKSSFTIFQPFVFGDESLTNKFRSSCGFHLKIKKKLHCFRIKVECQLVAVYSTNLLSLL